MKKNKHRLLFQIAAIVLPICILLTAGICLLVYHNSVNSFLESQNTFMEERIELAYKNIFSLAGETNRDEAAKWMVEYLEENGSDVMKSLTEQEEAQLSEHLMSENAYTNDWFVALPEDIKQLYMRMHYPAYMRVIKTAMLADNYNSLFFIDVTEGHKGLVLMDIKKGRDSLSIGSTYDINIDEHSAISGLIGTSETDTLFERNNDFPYKGSNYIGCMPVKANGETIGVLGITYDWNSMRESLKGTMLKSMLISIGGMLTVMAALLIFLYRGAVKPVSQITKAVGGYKDDNSTENIVKNMHEVRANNELGYLSDAIADFAIDIDRSHKENLRIAVERERAEAERERAEKEAYEAKVAVMASQIRPHFMYNALTSIAMMCQIDPETAQEATVTFAKYLRGNMDSLKQTKPVPFEVELEHLKKYLYIEKLRFGKKLNVEYDIQAKDFKVPMLSVQPLAENAVKHGVGMKKKGGTVKIISRETETAFEVVVSDDGVGFDTTAEKPDDGRSHVGMENTRSRLKEMCGGTVKIESTVDVGTTATIILPKEGQNNEDTVS